MTNREVAALVVTGVLLIFVFSRPGRRQITVGVRGVLRSLIQPWIALPLVAYLGWLAGSVALAARLGVWESDLLKITMLWVALSGLVLVFRLNDAIRQPRFFRRALLDTLGLSAAVEFLATLESFPLWIELPAQALAFLMAGVVVVAQRKPDQALVRRIASGYLFSYGLIAIAWAAVQIVSEWGDFDSDLLVRELLAPIWLTAAALVFVFGFAVVAAYESAFKRMRFWKKDEPLWRQRSATLLRANFRLSILRLMTGYGARDVAQTGGFRAAWRAVGVVGRSRGRGHRGDEASP